MRINTAPLSVWIPCLVAGNLIIASILMNVPTISTDITSAIDDDITITVDSACTIGQTVTSAHTTELNPGETNTTIGQSRIAAYCNDSEGYAIYAIGYTNSEYGNTNLVSTDGNYTIPTGTSGSNSYWNMRLTQGTASGTTSYLPTMVNEFTTNTTIPSDYTKVAYRDSSTISQNQDPTITGSYFTTTYEAHISTTQPAGIYTGQVQYVMVHPSGAPAPEIPYTMQNTAPIKRKLLNIGDSLQATDIRDGKKYWVTKLADGNIWMTQNLDLDLDSTRTYTSEDTDVQTEWMPLNSTSITGNWSNDSYRPYSLDPGDKYYYTSNNENEDTTYQSLSACKQAGHNDCSHYPSGNYYNWPAAVASNNITDLPEQFDAPNSICPAGWRLPLKNIATGASEIKNLLIAQGGILGSSLPYGSGSSWQENGLNIARISPLYLIRAGFISYKNTSGGWQIFSKAAKGAYWTGSIRDNSDRNNRNAYGPDFDASAFYDSIDLTMNGNAIRCIAR